MICICSTRARAAYRRARARGHSAEMLIGDDIENVDFAVHSDDEAVEDIFS